MANSLFAAVYDAHNVAGDFIGAFDGPLLGELIANPTNNGVDFFRLHKSLFGDFDSADAQSRFVENLHAALHEKYGRGLAAVICLSGMGSHPADFAQFFERAKAVDPVIKTIAVCDPDLKIQNADFQLNDRYLGGPKNASEIQAALGIAQGFESDGADIYERQNDLAVLAANAIPDVQIRRSQIENLTHGAARFKRLNF